MKKISFVIEYLLVRGLEAFFSAPAVETGLKWGEAFGSLMKRIMAKRDRLIVANLAASFPEKSSAEIRRIADATWRNIGRVAVEFLRANEILTPDRVIIEGKENVDRALAGGKGVIVISPHYCNWEYTGIMIQRFVGEVVAIVRPMKNPHVERFVQEKRSSGGIPFILHRDAVKASFKRLRGNGGIGILCDQNLYTGGIFVKFFGRPAATTTLPALLTVRTGAPIVLAHTRREDGKFRLVLETLVLPDASEETRVEIYTQAINDAMERIIRARPEWWFWIHNRWKRSPPPAAPGTAA